MHILKADLITSQLNDERRPFFLVECYRPQLTGLLWLIFVVVSSESTATYIFCMCTWLASPDNSCLSIYWMIHPGEKSFCFWYRYKRNDAILFLFCCCRSWWSIEDYWSNQASWPNSKYAVETFITTCGLRVPDTLILIAVFIECFFWLSSILLYRFFADMQRNSSNAGVTDRWYRWNC